LCNADRHRGIFWPVTRSVPGRDRHRGIFDRLQGAIDTGGIFNQLQGAIDTGGIFALLQGLNFDRPLNLTDFFVSDRLKQREGLTTRAAMQVSL
jgi:hypothetical protein